MIACDLYRLAWTLQAHVPDLRIRDTVRDPLMQNPWPIAVWRSASRPAWPTGTPRSLGKPSPATSTAGAVATPISMSGSVRPRRRRTSGPAGMGITSCRSGRPGRCSRSWRSSRWWRRSWAWLSRLADGQANRVSPAGVGSQRAPRREDHRHASEDASGIVSRAGRLLPSTCCRLNP
jgi:hypothetical protein